MKKNLIVWALILCFCMILAPLTAVAAKTPDLMLEDVKVSNDSIRKGDTFTVSFVLRNYASYYYKDISIQVIAPNFSLVGKGSTIYVTSGLGYQASKDVVLNLKCHDTKSNELTLLISCKDFEQNEYSIEEKLILNFHVEDTSQNQPELSLSTESIPVIEAGDTIKLQFTLTNQTKFAAKSVTVSPILSDALLEQMYLNNVKLEPQNCEISAGESETLWYEVTANGIATPGIYPIRYQVNYKNNNQETFNQTLDSYVKIVKRTNQSGLFLNSINTDLKEKHREKLVKFAIELQNNLSQDLNHVEVWIEGLPKQNFVSLGEDQRKSLSIESTQSSITEFQFEIEENTTEGAYPYEVFYRYTDLHGNDIWFKDSLIFNYKTTTKKGLLELTNLKVPGQAIQDQAFEISFILNNTGEADLEDVEICFQNNAEVWAASKGTIHIKKMKVNQKECIQFQCVVLKQEEAKTVPFAIQIRYDAKPGKEVEQIHESQNLGVLVGGSHEVSTQPRLMLYDLTIPDSIVPGNEFELGFSVQNTNQKKKVQNLKITLSSIDPETQVSNIITVGQGDSLFLSQLGCNEKDDTKIKLIVPATFSKPVCDLKVNLDYEDEKGNSYQDETMLHLPISTDTKLTASDIRLGKVNEEGYSLEMDFYNTGKGVLKNLMVDLEGDYESTNSNYYVGDLQSGRMDIYSVYMNGKVPEHLKGNVIFTYDDAAGQNHEVKIPFDIQYKEPVVEAISKDIVKEDNSSFPIVIGLGIIIILIVLGIVYKKRKAT